jgi:hypothetical protein
MSLLSLIPLAVLENYTSTTLLRIETNLNLLAINVCLHAGTHVAAFGISSLLIAFAGLILHLCNLYRQCQLDRRSTCVRMSIYDWYDSIMKRVTAQKILVATAVVFIEFWKFLLVQGRTSR